MKIQVEAVSPIEKKVTVEIDAAPRRRRRSTAPTSASAGA